MSFISGCILLTVGNGKILIKSRRRVIRRSFSSIPLLKMRLILLKNSPTLVIFRNLTIGLHVNRSADGNSGPNFSVQELCQPSFAEHD